MVIYLKDVYRVIYTIGFCIYIPDRTTYLLVNSQELDAKQKNCLEDDIFL